MRGKKKGRRGGNEKKGKSGRELRKKGRRAGRRDQEEEGTRVEGRRDE